MASLRKNISISIGSYMAGAILLLAVTPMLIRDLGLENFGLFTLITSISAPLGILTAGLGQMATRAVAAADREISTHKTIETVFALNIAVGAFGMILLWFGSSWLCTVVFKLDTTVVPDAQTAIKLAGVLWFSLQVSGTYQAVLLGLQDFNAIGLLTILQQAISYGIGAVAVHFIPLVPVLIATNIISVLIVFLLAATRACRRTETMYFPKIHLFELSRIWRFSSWQIVNVGVATLSNHVDRLLLGAIIGPAEVGIYGAANNVQARVVAASWAGIGTLFPVFSSLSDSRLAGLNLLRDRSWKILFLGVTPSIVLFSFAPWFAPLWLGNKIGPTVAEILRVLFVTAIIALPSGIVYQYLLGAGRSRLLAICNGATTLITVFITALLIIRYGLAGAAWGMLVAVVLCRPTFHFWLMSRDGKSLADNEIRQCWSALYAPTGAGVIACAVSYGCGRLASFLSPGLALFNVCSIAFLAGGFAYLLVAWATNRSGIRSIACDIGQILKIIQSRIKAILQL